MDLKKAIKLLEQEYKRAQEMCFVRNPLAWALYRVWKKADGQQDGRDAILRSIPDSPHPDGDASILACPNCGSGEYLHNLDGAEMRFCGQCGQAIKWEGEYGTG